MSVNILGFEIEMYYLVILLPLIGGLFGYLINRLRTEFNFVGFVLTLFFAIKLFIISRNEVISQVTATIFGFDAKIYIDSLAGFILLFNAIFAFLIWVYSLKAMSKKPRERAYYLYIALTLAAANGVVLSGNLIFLLIFWNVLVFSLYGILLVGKKDSSFAARKAITIIGVADFAMMLGIVILLVKTGTVNFPFAPKILLNDPWLIFSYILIFIGAIAKAGAMPLHTWIPESAKVVPASTMAFIPASLDKLLGIYLLIRVSYFIFDISGSMPIRIILMAIGAITIIAAVMMAMVQKEAMRLLSFHAVSQVGYMVMGIGTGIPIGIAGGLFHMINHAIYKSCLFLSAGSVEHRTKTTQLDNLGGLGTKMPVTMFTFIVAAFAISGVPPFNGFYSKWMVYQGVVELSGETNLWPIFLIAAMFGSVLTLASFLKMIHSLFLGQRPKVLNKVREARFDMVVPSLILASACIIFGVFAKAIPLKHLILPALPFEIGEIGFWDPRLATILIIVGVIIGLIVFLLGTAKKPRRSKVFIGGEILDEEAARITGPNFYSSVNTLGMLKKTYDFGEGGAFDFYNYLLGITRGLAVVFRDVINSSFVGAYKFIGKLTSALSRLTSALHTGELYNYVGWLFLGGIIILILLVL
ncbi:Na(+)/H(+) antiporter subunit A [subsurface metagenome]|jgi:formate hydrogenlyase subunit 3/multisubunit Na+/H+ antiporter MnhD subunit